VAESAIIVPVPRAERFVAQHRERFGPAERAGVPAHVTLLFPFLAPASISPGVHEQLRALASAKPSFRFRSTDVRRFSGTLYSLRSRRGRSSISRRARRGCAGRVPSTKSPVVRARGTETRVDGG